MFHHRANAYRITYHHGPLYDGLGRQNRRLRMVDNGLGCDRTERPRIVQRECPGLHILHTELALPRPRRQVQPP